ncbi:MAG TPA: ABC transporter substrate-binding protein [Vineibacter sp.]|nr:ABC transporter substrate-binding protein [Vineibacter sp.]
MRAQKPGRRQVMRWVAGLAAGTAGFPAILKAADTIKIGFLGPLSGALAFVGQTNQNCLALAVSEINAAGGIAGRSVEVVAEDSQMSTKVTLDKARKLFQSDGVVAITGPVLPSEREAVLSVAAATKRYLLYPNFDEGRCHPNLIVTGLSMNQSTVPLIPWLTKNVGKTAFIIASDLGTTRDVGVPTFKTEMEKHGGKLLGVQYFPFGTRDFGPVLQQVASIGPDIVYHLIGDDPITFVKQYKSFDMKPQLVTPLVHESITSVTDDAAIGHIGIETYYMSVDTPANRVFVDGYSQRFTAFTPRRVRGNVVVQPHGERTYVAAKLLAEAIRQGGGTDMEALRRGFAKTAIEAPRGSVRVDLAASHLVTDTLVGKVAADRGIDVIARLGPIAPTCT